ncbi:MAG: TrkH family potassium uptake protein [Thermoplasmata archaeon]|nr:TrkH family potassium uptake protein [Thermoplasmata archaeon]
MCLSSHVRGSSRFRRVRCDKTHDTHCSVLLRIWSSSLFWFERKWRNESQACNDNGCLRVACNIDYRSHTIHVHVGKRDRCGMDPLSAIFESFAGWTGTGLTMVIHENKLPYTLQFWRTLTQWVGGVGVIVLTLAILARPGTGSFVLYKSEGREQKIHPSVISTVRSIWWIYLFYTAIGIAVLFTVKIFSENRGNLTEVLWESINHCMTGLSTGGFSVTDDSIASYSVYSQIVIMVLMILGAIAFVAHYDLLTGKVKKFFYDPQTKALFVLIIFGVVLLIIFNHPVTSEGIQKYVFQFISAITCTGFSTDSLSSWSETSKLILSFAMIVGGAAGSTAGGIKLFRIILLTRGVEWRLKKALSTPKRVLVYKLGDKSLSPDSAFELVNEAAVISFLWFILLFAGILVISYSIPNRPLGDIIFEVCSAQGNVGLSVGITSPSMPALAKVMLILNMWIGRLEIIPVIVMIKSLFGGIR